MHNLEAGHIVVTYTGRLGGSYFMHAERWMEGGPEVTSDKVPDSTIVLGSRTVWWRNERGLIQIIPWTMVVDVLLNDEIGPVTPLQPKPRKDSDGQARDGH
jgi:hypothetical protein